jgi:hypothetical protein
MTFRPDTAKPMNEPAEMLLRGPHALCRAERKRIATYVSSRNDCSLCPTVDAAVAARHWQGNGRPTWAPENAAGADRASGKEGYAIPYPLLSRAQNA